MLQVSTDGVQDGRCELLAECFTLKVDVFVTASGEINSFEATCFIFMRLDDLLCMYFG